MNEHVVPSRRATGQDRGDRGRARAGAARERDAAAALPHDEIDLARLTITCANSALVRFGKPRVVLDRRADRLGELRTLRRATSTNVDRVRVAHRHAGQRAMGSTPASSSGCSMQRSFAGPVIGISPRVRRGAPIATVTESATPPRVVDRARQRGRRRCRSRARSLRDARRDRRAPWRRSAGRCRTSRPRCRRC